VKSTPLHDTLCPRLVCARISFAFFEHDILHRHDDPDTKREVSTPPAVAQSRE
jgi:hypothetical protein